MAEVEQDWITVEAEVRAPAVTAQLVELHHTEPCDIKIIDRDVYWLDMSFTPRPRNTRLCYQNHWSRQRFEPIGKVFFLPPEEDVLFRSDGGSRQRSIFCHLNPQSLSEWLDIDLRWKGPRLEASLDIAEPRVKNLLIRLAEEMQQPGFASELFIELLTGQLAIELGRYFVNFEDKINFDDARSTASKLSPWRLQLIDEHLHEEQQLPSLAELAELCHLSVRQLTRSFRASRGCSIGEYIANHRIEKAKQLLGADHSIKTIAYLLGFSAPSGFCSAFRRATGMSPGDFRAQFTRRH